MGENEIEHLLTELRDCPGRAIHEEETRIATTLDVVAYNKYALETEQRKMREEATPNDRPPVSQARQTEFFRDLHNYTSALYTLYKHGNRYKQKFFCRHSDGARSCDTCDRENIESLKQFGVLPDWDLIRKLRVYTNHYRTPLLQSPLTYESRTVGDSNLLQFDDHRRLVLNKDRFLTWARETDNTEANELVTERDVVRPVVSALELYDANQRYYEWFLGEVRKRNADSIQEFDVLVQRLQQVL